MTGSTNQSAVPWRPSSTVCRTGSVLSRRLRRAARSSGNVAVTEDESASSADVNPDLMDETIADIYFEESE